MSEVLAVRHLSKAYGETSAVSDVSFSVRKGEIVGLLGPNGAGKTTTLNMVLGVLEPSGGSVSIAGFNITKERQKALSHTNFAAVYSQLPGNLTVAENLRVFAHLYSVVNVRARVADILGEFDLTKFANQKAGTLSSGEQTRLSIGKAMLNDPELLLLDEPTASLDPATAKDIREQIVAHAKKGNAGVLWTSHNMYEVTEVCDRVLFLSRGKILLEGDPKKLPEEHGKKNLEELFIAVAREPLELES